MSVKAEELEIVIKGNIKDAVQKLDYLKNKINNVLSKQAKALEPNIKSVNKTMVQSAKTAATSMSITNREIDLQEKKLKKLMQAQKKYNEYQKAQAKIKSGKLNAQDFMEAYSKTGDKMPKDYSLQIEKEAIKLDKMKLSANATANKMQKKLSPALKQVKKDMKKVSKEGISVTRIFKRMTVSMVIGRLIRTAINEAIAGIGDLAKFSDRFNGAMTEMKTSFLWLRNSMTTAISPIIEGLAPVITRVTDALAEMFTTITMYTTALFTNSKTYVRAKKVTSDYAKSLGEVADAQQRTLAGFDELNVLSEQQKGTGLPTAEDMFEEVAIPEKVLKTAGNIKKVYEELKPVILALSTAYLLWKGNIDGTNSSTGKLTEGMEGKNEVLKEQTTETQKETSAVKKWAWALGGAAVGTAVLKKGMEKLQEKFPLGMPTGEVVAFDESTQNANVSVENLGFATQDSMQLVSKSSESLVKDFETDFQSIYSKALQLTRRIEVKFQQMFEEIRRQYQELMEELDLGTDENPRKEKLNNLKNAVSDGAIIDKAIDVATGVSLGTGIVTGIKGVLSKIPSLIPGLATGGVLTQETLFVGGEYPGAGSNPEIVAPQSMMYETNMKANVPVMNAIEELGDKITEGLSNISVYADFGYDKLRVGLNKENKRIGQKAYGGGY